MTLTPCISLHMMFDQMTNKTFQVFIFGPSKATSLTEAGPKCTGPITLARSDTCLFLLPVGNYLIMPSGNLQIANATQDDEGPYKCAAYNPVTQEVKTSISADRLRIRRES